MNQNTFAGITLTTGIVRLHDTLLRQSIEHSAERQPNESTVASRTLRSYP